MEALLVHTDNKEDLELIQKLMNKSGVKLKTISAEDLEDIGLSVAMKEADRTKKVSQDVILRKLRK